MDGLKSVILSNTPNFEGNTKNSLAVIKQTLDDVLAEKEGLKDIIENVRNSLSLFKAIEFIRMYLLT